ncbi:hemerythrin-like domain-containing protein [Pullulanibacillus pueri]|uniref:Hemerythrin-like domain-containing protein n=1 Tax=Pullulanibacillus pueri TaxID=1437324 RepID=A0A8J3EKL5_9BACL|nr:hemerythrin domain-containing protein [Pullulanibacillus pueri]MBM7680317.1 hemerythrin-like domain-containing protein [Pullulanibacillus pueri]GGH75686.1 hypothetical protein GCM10007096_05170 [Pullulanibacillus pueri]
MKRRHEALIPLSHHHYHGLVIALKLQNASKEKGRWTLEEIKQDTQRFWENGGAAHFREEEEVLYPTFSRYSRIEELPEMSQILLEHVQLRAMFSQLINHEGQEDIPLMHAVGTLLKKHIRTEERVIFPLIQESVPEDVLKRISSHFSAHEEIYNKG